MIALEAVSVITLVAHQDSLYCKYEVTGRCNDGGRAFPIGLHNHMICCSGR